MMKQFLAFGACALLVLSGCKKNDRESPFIQTARLSGNVSTVPFATVAGATLTLEVSFTDDVDLDRFEADLHPNFDGHAHKTEAVPATWSQTVGMEGTEHSETLQIQLPADAAAGAYHLTLICFDKTGKQSEEIVFEFSITNGSQPVVSITAPTTDPVVSYNYNDTIHIAGSAADETDLATVLVTVRAVELDAGTNPSSDLYSKAFVLSGGSDTNWEFAEVGQQGEWIIVPGATPLGLYALIVVSTDVTGHTGSASVSFRID